MLELPPHSLTALGEAYVADCVQFRILDAFDNDSPYFFARHVAAFKALFGIHPPCLATEIVWKEMAIYTEECADPVQVLVYAEPAYR